MGRRFKTAVQRGTELALRAVDAPPSLESIERYLALSRAAEHDKTAGGELLQPPRASLQSWRETLYNIIADGTAVTAAAETILVPDFTLPAYYMYQGRALKYTLFGRLSSAVTTPGTFTMRQRWGGVGGVSMAASGAWAPETGTVATNLAWYCGITPSARSARRVRASRWAGCRSGYDGLGGERAAPRDGAVLDVPAVATIDTTIAKALSATYQPSLGTASCTCHIAILESLS